MLLTLLSNQGGGALFTITGVTRDSTGNVVVSCVVHLFATATDVEAGQTTSDAGTGVYAFTLGSGVGTYYVVAYKAGSPDIAGTTVNTLTPVAL